MNNLSNNFDLKTSSIVAKQLCKYTLGFTVPDEVVKCAVTLLENGIENQEIVEMAGLSNPRLNEIKDLFVKCINKFGLSIPSISDSTLYLAQLQALEILNGKISPYFGARTIWTELSNIEGSHSSLSDFVGSASDYEEVFDEGAKQKCEKNIIEESKELLLLKCDHVLLSHSMF